MVRAGGAGPRLLALAACEHVPANRRPFVSAATPAQAADVLRPYLDLGFTGFTFNNSLYRTSEQVGLLGELLKTIGG